MQLTPYELALISGGFTVAGVLLGSFLTYRFALSLARQTARREAGRRLREAFAAEIAALHPVSGDHTADVEQLLASAFLKHREAVTEFSFYLRPFERERFLEAWRSYYEVCGSVRFFDYYMGEKPWEKFQERVNAILAFADT